MRRILIATGILGGGTALTFAAAALAATLLPGGTVIPSNAVSIERNWVKGGPAVPVPAPPVVVDDGSSSGGLQVVPMPAATN